MTDSADPSNETWDVIRHLFEGGELCGQTTRTDPSDSHVCGCFRKPHADANHVCPCGSRWSTDEQLTEPAMSEPTDDPLICVPRSLLVSARQVLGDTRRALQQQESERLAADIAETVRWSLRREQLR